jgi:hypothetical protein
LHVWNSSRKGMAVHLTVILVMSIFVTKTSFHPSVQKLRGGRWKAADCNEEDKTARCGCQIGQSCPQLVV